MDIVTAMTMAKASLNAIEEMSLRDGYRYEQNLTGQLGKSADSKEAMLAFAINGNWSSSRYWFLLSSFLLPVSVSLMFLIWTPRSLENPSTQVQ